MVGDRKDSAEMELEDAPFNFPIKKVVPMRKSLQASPVEGSGSFSLKHKQFNLLNLSTEDLPDSTNPGPHDDSLNDIAFTTSPERRNGSNSSGNSPGTPTFLLRHNPEGSAFKLVESPGNSRHVNKVSLARDAFSLTPGLIFMPENSKRDASYVGERSSSDLGNTYTCATDDSYGYSGAFEHHVRFPTPLNKMHRYENQNRENFMNFGWQHEEESKREEDDTSLQSPNLGLDFSPNSGSSYNYKNLTESPSSDVFCEVLPKSLFGNKEDFSSQPDIMGIVSQLVHSQLAPESFIKSYLSSSSSCYQDGAESYQDHGEGEGEVEAKGSARSAAPRYDLDPRDLRTSESLFNEQRPDDRQKDNTNRSAAAATAVNSGSSCPAVSQAWNMDINSGAVSSDSFARGVQSTGAGGLDRGETDSSRGGHQSVPALNPQTSLLYPAHSMYDQQEHHTQGLHGLTQHEAAYQSSFQQPRQQLNQQHLLQLLLLQQQQTQHAGAPTLDSLGFSTPQIPSRYIQPSGQNVNQMSSGSCVINQPAQPTQPMSGKIHPHAQGPNSDNGALHNSLASQMLSMPHLQRDTDHPTVHLKHCAEPSFFPPNQLRQKTYMKATDIGQGNNYLSQTRGCVHSNDLELDSDLGIRQLINSPRSGTTSTSGSGTWASTFSHPLPPSRSLGSTASSLNTHNMSELEFPNPLPQPIMSQSWSSPFGAGPLGCHTKNQTAPQQMPLSLSQDFSIPSNTNWSRNSTNTNRLPSQQQQQQQQHHQGAFAPFVYLPPPPVTSQYHAPIGGQMMPVPGLPTAQYGQYVPQGPHTHAQQRHYTPVYPSPQYAVDYRDLSQHQQHMDDDRMQHEDDLSGRLGSMGLASESRFQFLDANSHRKTTKSFGQQNAADVEAAMQSYPATDAHKLLVSQNAKNATASSGSFHNNTHAHCDFGGSSVSSLNNAYGNRQYLDARQQQQQQQQQQFNQKLLPQMVERERSGFDRDFRSSRDLGSDSEKPYTESKQRERDSWDSQGSSLFDLHRGGHSDFAGQHVSNMSGLNVRGEDLRNTSSSFGRGFGPLSQSQPQPPMQLQSRLQGGQVEDPLRLSMESRHSQSFEKGFQGHASIPVPSMLGRGAALLQHSDGPGSGNTYSAHASNALSHSSSTAPLAAGLLTTPSSASTSAVHATSSTHPAPKERLELVESPHSKLAYKDFYRHFRGMERESVEVAKQYAEESLTWMPETARWRVLLELADLAKRSNDFDKARELYGSVCELQPLASQGWLEWAKMEEECGQVKFSLKILREGLSQCKLNEGLLTKAIKQQEKLHDVDAARGMLSALRHESIERVWKAVLEGALLEARAGRIPVARKFLQYLIQHVPWYGPIYFEAFKLEDRDERDASALCVVKKGLKELPRYGPLWFGLLKIIERRDCKSESRNWLVGVPPVLARTREEAGLAVRCISRELVWKIHFEKAQAEERAADSAALGMYSRAPKSCALKGLASARDSLLGNARISLVKSLLSCPANLQWKVWLAGARLELSAGSLAKARSLLCQAFKTVPAKSRFHVFLECSRVEEYAGNLEAARRILARARNEVRGEWKVFLESVLLEARAGNHRGAVRQADEALLLHAGTGRLWAILVLICHRLEGLIPAKIRRKKGGISKSVVRVEESPDRMDDIIAHCNNGDNTQQGATLDRMRGENDRRREVVVRGVGDDERNSEERMWSSSGDDDYPILSKLQVLLRAIQEVPKSGEVWCEGARCHMNPLHLNSFDLSSAQKFLSFAVQFTPQYGDTFLELLRLEMLLQVILPRVLNILGMPIVPFFKEHLGHDVDADSVSVLSDFGWLQTVLLEEEHGMCVMSVPGVASERKTRRANIAALHSMHLDIGHHVEAYRNLQLKNLSRRCTNSDPNYGTTWFHYRSKPYDTPHTVLKTALHLMTFEIASAQPLYVRAVTKYIQKSLQKSLKASEALPKSTQNGGRGRAKEKGHDEEKIAEVEVVAESAVAHPPAASVTEGDIAIAHTHSTALTSDLIPSVSSVCPLTSSLASSSLSPCASIVCDDLDCDVTAFDETSPRDEEVQELLALQSTGDPIQRVKELLEDFDIVLKGRASSFRPLIVGGEGGPVYCAPDFVTASIEMNRALFNRQSTAEERRKVLFGSDQIVP